MLNETNMHARGRAIREQRTCRTCRGTGVVLHPCYLGPQCEPAESGAAPCPDCRPLRIVHANADVPMTHDIDDVAL